jgi:hypothetical protein
LYPYENAFRTCEENGWKFIFSLQDSSLKTVQEELTLTRRRNPVTEWYRVKKGWGFTEKYRYQTAIEYHQKYTLNWVQCIETKQKIKQKESKQQPITTCFEYVTNIEPDRENVQAIAAGGRLRWKIENEGFNTQKRGDYELEHKYCRNSYNGFKNYYILLQIASAINQLIEKERCIAEILKLRPKETLRNLWGNLKGYMVFCKPDTINSPIEIVHQIREAPT